MFCVPKLGKLDRCTNVGLPNFRLSLIPVDRRWQLRHRHLRYWINVRVDLDLLALDTSRHWLPGCPFDSKQELTV
jgi:hypothetical protein